MSTDFYDDTSVDLASEIESIAENLEAAGELERLEEFMREIDI